MVDRQKVTNQKRKEGDERGAISGESRANSSKEKKMFLPLSERVRTTWWSFLFALREKLQSR